MPQTWHFSYLCSSPDVCSANPSGDGITLFDLPSLISLIHNLLLHLQGATWIVQYPFPSLIVPPRAQSAASPQLPSPLWGHGHVQGRQRKKGIQHPLTFSFRVQAASVCLSNFQFLKLQLKFWWQIVFPWVTQRGDVHSQTWPAGHHSFLWAMCSTAMNQILYSAGCTPKFNAVPIAITPRTLYATGSILDMAQRQQFQAVCSMDEKTLLYALLSKQEASEKPQSKMSLKQLKLENNYKNARVATSSNYTLTYLIIDSFLHFLYRD